ncbi:MAG TPA: phage baseplate assembly protein V [Thermoanaerobaculia bacterium]|nr:phage baseplate assembly protein V [Thermoanaerobaculia bacterium]
MHRLVSTIQQIARHEAAQQAAPCLGIVQSVHGSGAGPDYACTVQLRESGVVLPKVPIAVQFIGFASLPRENDLVLVAFAGGDLHAPVVIGRLYNEEVAPPANAPGELIAFLPGDAKTSTDRIELKVATDGGRKIELKLAGNSVNVEVLIDDGGIQFKAQDVVLALTQSGPSDGKAELKAGDAKVTLEQSGDVSVETTGSLKLKAGQIEIKADGSVKISGATVELN